MSRYVDMLKASSEETRLRALRVLVAAGEPLCVCELVDVLRRPQYAVSRIMGQLRSAGLVEEDRRGRLMYYRLTEDPFALRLFDTIATIPREDAPFNQDLDRLRWRLDLRQGDRCIVTYTAGYNPPEYQHKEKKMADDKQSVLFVCVHNSARSQMAEEYLRHFAGDLFEVESAGLEPGELNANVVKVMKEEGIDISDKQTRSVFDVYNSGKTFAYVVTVCSREAEEGCPIFPGPVRRLNWPFPDPSKFEGTPDEILHKTREVRDVIKEAVRQFVEAIREKDKSKEQAGA
ncbi:MAG: metalloregulator ArsR/SmtB family transcription factor [Spirochaetota bacterium]